ncbi:MAG: YeeE/YedE family protein [Nitrospirae bacterium]|nr:YeeE/YedE family protein [Nitrospirota bacterium]MBI3393904.1 YeeE/YedE family protein [Nitrospirota bacterium]
MDETTRKNQIWILVIVAFLSLVSIVTYMMNEYYIYLTAYLWFGFVYGMSLQYGRFCFSSAFRDLFAVGVPRMAVGIMIAMVLFGIVSAFVTAVGMSTFHAAPYGVHSVIAGLIFGVGMVLTGGCASGSLYKAGEGNGVAYLVILSISVTQAILADVGGWTNKLVPQSWHDSAVAKGLPATIDAGDGWMDQFLAGHVWDLPTTTYAEIVKLSNPYLAAYVGNVLVGIVLPAALILLGIYLIWVRKSFLHKRRKEGLPSEGLAVHLAGYWGMIAASRRTAIAGLVLGIAAGLHMFVMKGLQVKFGVQNFGELMQRMGITFGLSAKGTVFDPGYWYVTTQEAQWVGWVFNKLGWDNMHNIYFGLNNGIPNPMINPADWMSIALIGGAAVMALAHNEFKWKAPTLELAMWAVIGGALMGIGSRLGLGCNVGAFFVRVSQGDASGWLFGIGMIGGAYLGVRFFNWYTDRKMAKEMAACEL